MIRKLPKDLEEAEGNMLSTCEQALQENLGRRISLDIRFEGLRLLPVAIRLFNQLVKSYSGTFLLFPDAGSTALAKNNYPELTDKIYSFKEIDADKVQAGKDTLYIAISPQQYDYEIYQSLCSKHPGVVLMLNGRLEDSAVGIGSVGRERRVSFISSWRKIYWLEPINRGAIQRSYPTGWELYREETNGYVFVEEFEEKPIPELIMQKLI